MKKEILSRLLTGIFLLVPVLSLNIHAQTTPFFVMSPNDKEQYIYTANSWEYGSSTMTKSFHQTSVSSMVDKDGIRFFKGYCAGPSIYFGMDEANNKLYFLRDSTKIMMLDFNIPPGSSFVGQFPGEYTSHNITVTGSDSVRYYEYYQSHAQGGESTEYRVERGLGLRERYTSYSISNGRGFSDDWATFNLIRFNQNGDTLYKTQTWAPLLTYTPETTTSVFYKTFLVNTTHNVNILYSQYIPEINFNDSLFIRWYYTNGTDSTLAYETAIEAGTPVTAVSMFLDSVKMKAGYKFKYRFTLRDKFYRPKLVYHPSSTGYHTLSYDPSVGITEDEPQIPVSIDLKAYPNPFNPSTKVTFSLPEENKVVIRVFNPMGELVKEIDRGILPHGNFEQDIEMGTQSSGMYFCQVLCTNTVSGRTKSLTIKMALMK
ncbi:MAG: T9SS type A sorting domain-containing protein [Bacteroidetes bacterium]|nr:T9SS type A sorting domain-containing protein [Bacteroidota bacterium]